MLVQSMMASAPCGPTALLLMKMPWFSQPGSRTVNEIGTPSAVSEYLPTPGGPSMGAKSFRVGEGETIGVAGPSPAGVPSTAASVDGAGATRSSRALSQVPKVMASTRPAMTNATVERVDRPAVSTTFGAAGGSGRGDGLSDDAAVITLAASRLGSSSGCSLNGGFPTLEGIAGESIQHVERVLSAVRATPFRRLVVPVATEARLQGHGSVLAAER